MGCWNATCMGFHLPILAGEPVIAFVLMENPYEPHGTYSTTEYTPILAIRGEYDEYGGLEEIKDRDAVLAMLRAIPDVKARSAKGRPSPYVPETVNDFIEKCSAGLYVAESSATGSTGRKAPLALRVVFMKPAFLDLAKTDPANRAFLDRLNRLAALDGISAAEPGFVGAMQMATQLDTCVSHESPHPVARRLLARNLIANPRYAASSYVDIATASCVLDDLRMAWHVPSGGGSQRSVSRMNGAFIDAYGNICAEMPNDDGPDDDEEE